MSATGLIKSGVAFAKSLFKSSAKTTSKTALTATEKAAIKATEKELFDSTSKAVAMKSAKAVPHRIEKIHMERDKFKVYDFEGNLTSVAHFDKNNNLTCSQSVYYDFRGKPSYLSTISNPTELNSQPVYRLYNYGAKGQLKSINTTTSIASLRDKVPFCY